ncbi:MAG: hypothetical protein UT24_C0016G0022 [Candidatus Woesebacteria bacterium GW2011_GWB1_39_12]|uniref:Uncharacterized protein n=1 Tax=Candidatus Woesebacteria bacterium GW2011_GWB1_39_12 TaxID=1618574 RepID=A0A0G0MAD9_9BACT|nr:MAG: hypothetical protein UT24_C0016G0022 [Candidatus Woesebacteria bacterium GW2011_GWB1_39_12]
MGFMDKHKALKVRNYKLRLISHKKYMKIYDLDGVDIDEVFRELESLEEKKKEVRKEEKEKAKERFDNYKLKLNGI